LNARTAALGIDAGAAACARLRASLLRVPVLLLDHAAIIGGPLGRSRRYGKRKGTTNHQRCRGRRARSVSHSNSPLSDAWRRRARRGAPRGQAHDAEKGSCFGTPGRCNREMRAAGFRASGNQRRCAGPRLRPRPPNPAHSPRPAGGATLRTAPRSCAMGDAPEEVKPDEVYGLVVGALAELDEPAELKSDGVRLRQWPSVRVSL